MATGKRITDLPSKNNAGADDLFFVGADGDAALSKVRFDTLRNAVLNAVYPVGSIYMSASADNPGTLFPGTTWIAWGNGKVPVGYDGNDTKFDAAEKTGGSSTNSYTPTGTVSETALTESQMPAHSHTIGAHSHGLNDHKHSIPALSGIAANNGEHSHYLTYDSIKQGTAGASIFRTVPNGSGTPGSTPGTKNAGAHEHAVTTNASITGGQSSQTSDSPAYASGLKGSGAGHAHGFTGAAAAISTIQPYITCYMWKRTA